MKKLLPIFIILIIFGSAASAAEISGSVISYGKNLSDLEVTLSKINGTTQSDTSMTGVVYNFMPLAETATDKDGNYAFNDQRDGKYRINVTYGGITYGENIDLKGKAVLDFNLSGKIEGYVLKTNKTLEGIPVRLMDTSGVEVMNTLTNKSGKYSFNKVNVGSSYFAEATYADVPYTKQANASESADFIVYDSTKDGDVLSVNIDHIVFSKAPGGIKVDEYVEFMNTGDKVFFSKDRAWLGIWTPNKDVTRFQTDVMECCLQREKDAALIDPMRPIMPGETYSAQISYVMNPESSATFNKGTIYNTSYITLLSEKNNGFGIESQFAKKEVVPSEGKEFEVLSFMNVPKDQRLDIQIPGYVPSKTGSGEDFNYLIPVVAVVLIGAVAYPLLKNKIGKKPRRRFVKTAPAANVSIDEPQEAVEIIPQPDVVSENAAGKDITEMSFDELLAEKNAAFESILTLENRFKAGEIAEEEYKELKKEHKERSIAVIKQLKNAALNVDLNQPVPDLEKIITHVEDIDVLEEILEREKEGENRDELKEIIEQRIEYIEQNE